MAKSKIIYLLFIILLLQCRSKKVLFSSSVDLKTETKKSKPIVLDIISESSIEKYVQARLADTSIEKYIQLRKSDSVFSKNIKSFYQKRKFEYVWITPHGLAPRVEMFLNLMRGAEIKNDFSGDSLITIYNHIISDPMLMNSQQHLLDLELRLTYTFFEFANKEWSGSNEKQMKKMEWYIPHKKINYELVLDSLLNTKNEDFSYFYSPIYSQYDLLKKFLAMYKSIDESGGWLPIVADKKSYQFGDSSIAIVQFKKRLFLTGDFASTDSTIGYDSNLVKAVIVFQKRYGMNENGKIGLDVIREMNIPAKVRIKQIIINMERCRWVPFEPQGAYLMVNIPEYKLHIYEDSKNVWDLNVVVGKATNKTIIFNSEIQYLVLNPYWVVTSNIFKKEFLPKLKKNPNFLQNQNIQLSLHSCPDESINSSTIDWNQPSHNYNKYVLKQRPGPKNSLGKVKFIFPNEYSIYLHDTPAKTLFSLYNRSFSHGCIRVQNPDKLANYLLQDQPYWSHKTLERAWKTNKEQYVPLKRKFPVFIAYFTAG